MTLYIECCPREASRTRRLAAALLSKLGDYTLLDLCSEPLLPLDRDRLSRREECLRLGKSDDPILRYAKQFAAAETIVIAAPFWDLSFPARLKLYIENIYASGIVSRYNEQGIPVGLCRAKRLYFVTTAGGPLYPRFGYEYLRELATNYFGISETVLFKAELLDVIGNDPDAILSRAEAEIDRFFAER